MAVEAKRGCGYRKVGGLYFVGSGLSVPCVKMPVNLELCPVCGEGIRFFRGWRWIDPANLFGGDCVKSGITRGGTELLPCLTQCPFNETNAGLMWVGSRFYTPEAFIEEASKLGVSKRITAVPKDFKIGDWILLAHKKAGSKTVWRELTGEDLSKKNYQPDEVEGLRFNNAGNIEIGESETVPAIFYAFKPKAIELVITQELLDAMTPIEREHREKQGITYFIVPKDDKDHQGTAYDDSEEEAPRKAAAPVPDAGHEPEGPEQPTGPQNDDNEPELETGVSDANVTFEGTGFKGGWDWE